MPNDKLAEQIFIVQYNEGLGVSICHQWKNEIVVREYATSLDVALNRLKLEYGELQYWHEIEQSMLRETYLLINEDLLPLSVSSQTITRI